MNKINDKSPFNKMKGIFNNDIFKGNLKIMGKCGMGKSTLLFSLTGATQVRAHPYTREPSANLAVTKPLHP